MVCDMDFLAHRLRDHQCEVEIHRRLRDEEMKDALQNLGEQIQGVDLTLVDEVHQFHPDLMDVVVDEDLRQMERVVPLVAEVLVAVVFQKDYFLDVGQVAEE